MPQEIKPNLSVGNPTVVYKNLSYHGGENTHLSGRMIADEEATELTNVDISTVGIRSKRKGTLQLATVGDSSKSVQAITQSDFNGTDTIYAIIGGVPYAFDSDYNKTIMLGAELSNLGTCLFIPCNNVLYVLDSSGALFKTTDGLTMLPVDLLDASGNSLTGINCAVYFLGRMWYAADDFIYFSDVLAPESITNLPLRIAVGDGSKIQQLVPYRGGTILAFKFGKNGSSGSISVANVASDDPSSFILDVIPQYDGINLVSPQCVGNIEGQANAQVTFATTEGMRAQDYSALDQLVTPSLPFSYNEDYNLSIVNKNAYDSNFAITFNDELLWFVATGNNTTPNLCLAYTLKVQKTSLLQGWTAIDLMPATCATYASISGDDVLLLGTSDGRILQAFAQDNGEKYTEVSKRVDFGEPNNDKMLSKLTIFFSPQHLGSVDVSILFDDATSLSVGTITPGSTGGFNIPFNIPEDLLSLSVPTISSDLHFDSLNGMRKRGKDFRVMITSTDRPVIYGFQAEAIVYPARYNSLDTSYTTVVGDFSLNSNPNTPTTVSLG